MMEVSDANAGGLQRSRWLGATGLTLHVLMAAAMVLSAVGKLGGNLTPPGDIGNWMLTIGVGELATAILIVIPRTLSLGVLLASSFWGGAICVHLMHQDPWWGYFVPSVMLLITWIGTWLRDRRLLFSFQPESK